MITRGPAKPIKAPGSARIISPSMAKLAETPPIVGSVRIEIYGSLSFASLLRAADVLAICIRDRIPSCMRAPPEHERIIRGVLFIIALSIDLVIFSPTTTPMLPPINPNSKKQIST